MVEDTSKAGNWGEDMYLIKFRAKVYALTRTRFAALVVNGSERALNRHIWGWVFEIEFLSQKYFAYVFSTYCGGADYGILAFKRRRKT